MQNAASTVGTLFSNVAKLIGRSDAIDDEGEAASDHNSDPETQAEPAADPSDLPAEPPTKRRRCRRQKKPLNEYTRNTKLLYGAFWHLFPLQSGLRTDGPLTPTMRRHLLTQFHNAFAHCPQFLFMLADQVQRHAAASGAALRVKCNPGSFNAFADMVADRDAFLARLDAAQQDPMSKGSRDLLKSISRFVIASGKVVPWSAEERAGEVTRLYAMWRRFGPPSCFLSLAPDDVHQPTCLRLSYFCGDASSFPAVDGGLLAVLQGAASAQDVQAFKAKVAALAPTEMYEFKLEESFMQWLATRNPVTTTLFYERLTDAVFSVLVGVPPSHKRRKALPAPLRPRGFLGTSVSWSYVHETNGRKSLHFHASIHGGAAPALLANVVGITELEVAVAAALDSVYQAQAPMNLHAIDAARRCLKESGVKCTYFDAPHLEGNAASLHAFKCQSSFRALQYGFHTHAQTCHQGKAGKTGCRMARPAGHPVPYTRALALKPPDVSTSSGSQPNTDEDAVDWRCACCDIARNRSDASEFPFSVQHAKEGDGARPRVILAYELQRPLLCARSDGSPALKALLDMPREATDALSNQDALDYAQRVVLELGDVLALPDVSNALRQRLQSITAPEARILIDAWAQMTCRNAGLIEFSPTLTRLLNCNSAPLPLGAGQAAKAAGLYMCKYMIKEAYALAASLSVLLDARKHIEAYPTQAADAGSNQRTAQHFLQRVLNSTAAEIAPTQAAALVLGMPSAGHSHSFVYAYVWDAILLVKVLQRGGAMLQDAFQNDSVDASTANDSHAPTLPESEDASNDSGFESEGELPAPTAPSGRSGAAAVYELEDGDKVAVAQSEHYAYRDPALHILNYDEFVMSSKVTKATAADATSRKCGSSHLASMRRTIGLAQGPKP